ncbi:cation/H(+) antiporter 20-like [Coffea arabica]|uniref:Cation/H(+) antiporter 20-like n=1 Tax=Coffea arabica TaxID=13443 RepID=A0A6P6VAB2_COFAR|nr:cation/H(+) antiporter 20-like [Coffea arabica]
MAFNVTSVKTSSGGAWQGDNPLQFAFPLLIIQTTIVVLISRVLEFLFKPLRQPKVVAEILGGILLGPSALGRNKDFMQWIFPAWSTPILESVGSMGLLFFLFLVGLELDLSSIRRSGKRAFGIAAAGMSLPFLLGAGLTFLTRKVVNGDNHHKYGQLLMFMGVSLSITAFPVLARILAELRLLTTDVGRTAMAAAAFNDVSAWILLALAVALAGGGTGAHRSPLISLWVLLSGVAFVAFMLVFVRRIMHWVARQGSNIHEAYIWLTLAAVMVSGFMTDLIGIHAIFGAFIFGLTIPSDGEFARSLVQRIEDFVSGLLLPVYFASSGLKTDITKIRGLEAWGLLVLTIFTACAGKILATFFAAVLCMIPVRQSLALGVLMNTKGLVELIVLNIGKEKKVLDDEMFAILVLMALFTTFMTTPTVMAIYRPARELSPPARLEISSTSNLEEELRILMCIRGPGDSQSLINLVELCRSTKQPVLKLYVMQLLELTDRSSLIRMVQRVRRNGLSCVRCSRQGGELSNQIVAAFKVYGQLSKVTIRPTASISSLSTMHEDICHVAEKKRAAMLLLPFHKAWRREGNEEILMNLGTGWRGVNQMVLTNAPCSVALVVDGGFGVALEHSLIDDNALIKKVCILFLGGPDSQKALELGCRMAGHPVMRVTVVRLTMFKDLEDMIETRPSSSQAFNSKDHQISITPNEYSREQELDDSIFIDFRRKWTGEIEFVEKETHNLINEVKAIGQGGEFELVIVGQGRFPPAVLAELEDSRPEFDELGHVGDLIYSLGEAVKCSLLVIKQNDSVKDNKMPKPEMAN